MIDLKFKYSAIKALCSSIHYKGFKVSLIGSFLYIALHSRFTLNTPIL